jgi:hypothetical protein
MLSVPDLSLGNYHAEAAVLFSWRRYFIGPTLEHFVVQAVSEVDEAILLCRKAKYQSHRRIFLPERRIAPQN